MVLNRLIVFAMFLLGVAIFFAEKEHTKQKLRDQFAVLDNHRRIEFDTLFHEQIAERIDHEEQLREEWSSRAITPERWRHEQGEEFHAYVYLVKKYRAQQSVSWQSRYDALHAPLDRFVAEHREAMR